MAAKSKVITLLLFFVMFVVNACTHGGKCSLDEDMVNLIEGYRDTFCTLGIKHFQLRTNYYICEYNNCFSYIVSCDGKIIRDVQNNLTVISQNAACRQKAFRCILMIEMEKEFSEFIMIT